MICHDKGELESMSRKAYRTVIAQSYSLAPPSNSSTFKSNYSLMNVVWTEATDIAPLKSTMLGLLGELKIIFSYSSWTKDRSCSSFSIILGTVAIANPTLRQIIGYVYLPNLWSITPTVSNISRCFQSVIILF